MWYIVEDNRFGGGYSFNNDNGSICVKWFMWKDEAEKYLQVLNG